MPDFDRAFLDEAVRSAFECVAAEVAEMTFERTESAASAEERVAVVVGMTSRDGKAKGRILVDADSSVALAITEAMNGGPHEEAMNLYLFLAEFVNMVGGRAVTAINNRWKGVEFRLTPPAVFAGKGLDLLTPKVRSTRFRYGSAQGGVLLDAGFEGV